MENGQATGFWTEDEHQLADRFLADGYVVVPVESHDAVSALRNAAARLAAEHLGIPEPEDADAFLNRIHTHVDIAGLNGLRLAVIGGLNALPWARAAYFRSARRAIETIVGNELAMQLRLNLSIQLPNDDSSLLPLHADVWNGDSPYEVVVWLPLVDCFATKSMFLLPAKPNACWEKRMGKFSSTEALYQAVEPELRFLEVPFGKVLLFSQNQMHGNRINREPTTRWSMNCRFKGLLSPYADKRLGEFFEPITLRPATRLGANYHLPGAFR